MKKKPSKKAAETPEQKPLPAKTPKKRSPRKTVKKEPVVEKTITSEPNIEKTVINEPIPEKSVLQLESTTRIGVAEALSKINVPSTVINGGGSTDGKGTDMTANLLNMALLKSLGVLDQKPIALPPAAPVAK
jgi:hypothetical protein